MPVILILKKLGSVKELNIKDYDENHLYKKAGFKSDTDFRRHHQWDIELNGEVKFGSPSFHEKMDAAYGKLEGASQADIFTSAARCICFCYAETYAS